MNAAGRMPAPRTITMAPVNTITMKENYMANAKSPSMRAFLSVSSAFAFLFLALSGAILYVAPQCFVADATGWRCLFIGKDGWEAIHLTFALALLVLTPLHLWYNWSTFIGYIKMKTAAVREIPIPAMIAIATAAVLFLMSLAGIPPVSWIHDAREKIKLSWRKDLGPEDKNRAPGGRSTFRQENRGGSE